MGLIAVKEEVRKKDTKKSKKRSAVHARKSSSGAVGPFKKKKKTRPETSENEKTRQGDQTRPTSLKARWRIPQDSF